MPERSLQDQVALVTGAGRGIGRSIALQLAERGVGVALAARTAAELNDVQREIERAGGEAWAVPTDLADEAQLNALVERTIDRFGRLDLLINNAGLGQFGPFENTTAEQWDRIMAVNARGPFLLCRAALPHLRATAPRSAVVNIASVVGHKGYAHQAAYTASKHALMGMTKVLAKEVQAEGIRVHALCPGGVDTELVRQARPDLDPTGLMGPEEIAEIVLFLVTRQGNAVIDEIDVRRAGSTPWG